jgi:hypothetical protein
VTIDDGPVPAALTTAFAHLPVDGVAISTLGAPFGSETVSASNAFAARLDEVQLDLGEGPIWQALGSRTAELRPDLDAFDTTVWPAALLVLREAGAGAVFAFPMVIGTLDIGCVALYAAHATSIPARVIASTVGLVQVTARQVLAQGLQRAESERERGWNPGQYSRREVHQAAGMVAAQSGTNPADALLLLQAASFSAGRSLQSVSADVLERVIGFGGQLDPDAPGRNPA